MLICKVEIFFTDKLNFCCFSRWLCAHLLILPTEEAYSQWGSILTNQLLVFLHYFEMYWLMTFGRFPAFFFFLVSFAKPSSWLSSFSSILLPLWFLQGLLFHWASATLPNSEESAWNPLGDIHRTLFLHTVWSGGSMCFDWKNWNHNCCLQRKAECWWCSDESNTKVMLPHWVKNWEFLEAIDTIKLLKCLYLFI